MLQYFDATSFLLGVCKSIVLVGNVPEDILKNDIVWKSFV